MRTLALLLPLLLTACTLTVATPTPTPPPQAFAEQLWYALSLEAMTKDIFVDAAQSHVTDDLPAEAALPMMLMTASLMQASHGALSYDYPEIFTPHYTVAASQYTTLRDIGARWLQDGTLGSADVPAALEQVAANEAVKAYADWLIAHGYTHDDVEMMDVKLRASLASAFGTPTPTP